MDVLDKLNTEGWYIYQLWQHGPGLGFEVYIRRHPGLIARGRGSTINDALWDAWSSTPIPHEGEWEDILVHTSSARNKPPPAEKPDLLTALNLRPQFPDLPRRKL